MISNSNIRLHETVGHHVFLAAAVLGIAIFPSICLSQQPINSSPKKNVTEFNNIRLSDYDRINGTLTTPLNFHIVGSRTLIEILDSGDGKKYTLHADDITLNNITTKKGKQNIGLMDMKGHIRYELDRPKPVRKGDAPNPTNARQILKGTAGKAIYKSADDRLRLTGNVDATLDDPVEYREPAKFSAAAIVAPLNSNAPYEVTGSPGHSSIEITPRPKAKKKEPITDPPTDAKQDPPFEIGKVTLTAFETGTLLPGKEFALFAAQNEKLKMETENSETKSSGYLHAHEFHATYGDDGLINHARATGSVTYHFVQTLPPAARKSGDPLPGDQKSSNKPAGPRLQGIDGSSSNLNYLKNGDDRLIEFAGPFVIDITDTEQLMEPAHITGVGANAAKKIAADTFTYSLTTKQFDLLTPSKLATVKFKPRQTTEEAQPN